MSLKQDIRFALERDPATHSALELILTSPGLHAIYWHRVWHRLWKWRLRILSRWLANFTRWFTGIEIHPGAVLGKKIFIDHGMGVVIGETAVVGDEVLIYHGVTLGGKSRDPGKRHPTVGNRVIIGAGAKIIGPVSIGDDVSIGANAVITKDVAAGKIVVGLQQEITKKN